MSRIIVHKRAAKYLKALPRPLQTRLKETLQELSKDPLNYTGIIQMSGDWAGYYRIRLGQIRIIFWLDVNKDIIYVDHIGPRGNVYKN